MLPFLSADCIEKSIKERTVFWELPNTCTPHARTVVVVGEQVFPGVYINPMVRVF